MAVRKIVKYGADILRQKLKPVDFKMLEPLLPELLKDMEDTCLSVSGVGLSANQIGLDYRMAIILIPEKVKEGEPAKFKRYVIINPKIISRTGAVVQEEGCLSLPGLFADIERASNVVVQYLNENGLPIRASARGLLAKAFQHEIDHLDGKIFIDFADPTLKPSLKKAIKELSKTWT
jgi:peptide deformylase